MKSILPIICVLCLSLACKGDEDVMEHTGECPPLADTLATVFKQIKLAVDENRPDDFLHLMDPDEAGRLDRLVRRDGFASLRTFLEHHFVNWPDLDTLCYDGLIHEASYARLTFRGNGRKPSNRTRRVRYTFLLFRRFDNGWKLAAVSGLEKDRYDSYGTELSYLETDLPSRLRFPRLF